MAKTALKEIFLLRATACLCIVFLHCVTQVYDIEDGWVGTLRLLLSFGTPAFILISEIVLAHAYPTQTPVGFLTKRLRYIALPYVCFGFIYCVQDTFSANGTGDFRLLAVNLAKGFLLGETPAYFVAIILQFYLLHMFFVRYVFNRFRSHWILLTAGIVNIAYLAFFNLVPSPNNNVAIFIWERFYRMPFLGWIFYFVIAYYLGTHYNSFMKRLYQFRYYIYASVPLTGFISAYLLASGLVPVQSSKRFDMIFFTLCTVFLILLASSKLRSIPTFFTRISQYSFGIYLIHPLIVSIITRFTGSSELFHNHLLGVFIYFAFAIALSVAAVLVLYRLPFGSYMIGRIGIGPDLKRPERNKSGKQSTTFSQNT